MARGAWGASLHFSPPPHARYENYIFIGAAYGAGGVGGVPPLLPPAARTV